MSIASLIGFGLGPGGSVKYLVTVGLDIGTAPPVEPVTTGGGYPPKKVRDRAAEKRRRDRLEREALEAEAREIYERFVEGKKPSRKQAKAIAAAVKAHKEPDAPALPQAPQIDFAALLGNVADLRRLANALADNRLRQIAEEMELEQDDQDAMEIIMRFLQ